MESEKTLSRQSSLADTVSLPLCNRKLPSVYDEKDFPPMDGGFHAWMFLAACTMFDALVWGFAFSFGVFQNYYRHDDRFEGSPMIAVIGTCAAGVAYLSCPIAIVAMILIPSMSRWFSTIGLSIMCFSLAMASFSSNVTHLVLSQGIGFGIGGCIAYSPSILFMPEWFDRRRGLAFGVVWAGSGLSGIVFPIVLGKLLHHLGFRTTLRICSVLLFVMAAPFLYYHKARLPRSSKVDHNRLNTQFIFSRVFVTYNLGNILEALGFFLPGIYLPSFAHRIGATELVASLTVTVLNLASVFGSVALGFLTDRFHVLTCIAISTVGTVISVFLLWGFSTTVPVLLVFCVAYGLFAGSYSATWSGMIREVQKVDSAADPTIIFSLIAFGRGIGNVVSGPFSEFLLRKDSRNEHMLGAYGSGFGLVIGCTGLTAFLGGLCLVARLFKYI
ncbi:hypothetical protein N7495_006658 [Penicillium taxi]|uniref:uncharacterized protein n=1 Tax=Penicillium taxi TaxID=168475 RepID=UPI0025454B93|nr:uncharacterized protein N7495_006658 [Penicillium taxi]KAJ5894967.1 hypothetical protein N7495_006658 [Penicillium taxi]